MRLKDKVAFITGAGSGVGRATAKIFAKEGANIVVVDIDDPAAIAAAAPGTSGSRSAWCRRSSVAPRSSSGTRKCARSEAIDPRPWLLMLLDDQRTSVLHPGEGLVELGHPPAQTGQPFHQVRFVACIGDVQCPLDPGDPAAEVVRRVPGAEEDPSFAHAEPVAHRPAARRPAHALDESALDLADIDGWVDGVPRVMEYVGTKYPGFSCERVYHHLKAFDAPRVVLDVHNLEILDAPALETEINQLPGVVTVGLFARRPADVLIVAGDGGVILHQQAESSAQLASAAVSARSTLPVASTTCDVGPMSAPSTIR